MLELITNLIALHSRFPNPLFPKAVPETDVRLSMRGVVGAEASRPVAVLPLKNFKGSRSDA